MTVTNEIVKKAWEIAKENCDATPYTVSLILEAAAPMLIAQGMREAASIAGIYGELTRSDAILARAQEIDPK